jgi:hypothetical protein
MTQVGALKHQKQDILLLIHCCIYVCIYLAISNCLFCSLQVKKKPQDGVANRAFILELGLVTNTYVLGRKVALRPLASTNLLERQLIGLQVAVRHFGLYNLVRTAGFTSKYEPPNLQRERQSWNGVTLEDSNMH